MPSDRGGLNARDCDRVTLLSDEEVAVRPTEILTGLADDDGAGITAVALEDITGSSTDLPSEEVEVGEETVDEVGLMQGAVNRSAGPQAKATVVCTSPRAEARECIGATMCVSNTHKPYKEARCQTRGIAKGCVWRDGCCECIVGHYSRKSKDCLHRPALQDGLTSPDVTTEVVHEEVVQEDDEGESWEVVHDPSLSFLQVEFLFNGYLGRTPRFTLERTVCAPKMLCLMRQRCT